MVGGAATDVAIERHRTALGRGTLSRPLTLALEDGLLAERTVFDYGCGRGDDLARLRRLGHQADGWDPVYRPQSERKPAELVNLGYVVNVIEDPLERAATLYFAWDLASDILVVSARMHWEAKTLRTRADHGDGVLTAHRTFQKFYDQDELRTWISTTLQVDPVAAAPGVFYAFKQRQRPTPFSPAVCAGTPHGLGCRRVKQPSTVTASSSNRSSPSSPAGAACRRRPSSATLPR